MMVRITTSAAQVRAEKRRWSTTTYGDFSAESLIADSAMPMSVGEINISAEALVL